MHRHDVRPVRSADEQVVGESKVDDTKPSSDASLDVNGVVRAPLIDLESYIDLSTGSFRNACLQQKFHYSSFDRLCWNHCWILFVLSHTKQSQLRSARHDHG